MEIESIYIWRMNVQGLKYCRQEAPINRKIQWFVQKSIFKKTLQILLGEVRYYIKVYVLTGLILNS